MLDLKSMLIGFAKGKKSVEPCLHVPNMVPNDGSYVENIYFNANLSPLQIVEEIRKIPEECWYSLVEGDQPIYALYGIERVGMTGYIQRINQNEWWIEVADFEGQGSSIVQFGVEYVPEDNAAYFRNSGPRDPKLYIGADTIPVSEEGIKIGTANHLLTNLFSIRPFTTE